jgi:hypothetical protein
VCPVGLHVEGVLVICSRGTRVLVSLGKGEALTYPLGRVPTLPKYVIGVLDPFDVWVQPGSKNLNSSTKKICLFKVKRVT